MKVDLRHAMDIGPEDHLPNGKVKLSAALLKIAARWRWRRAFGTRRRSATS